MSDQSGGCGNGEGSGRRLHAVLPAASGDAGDDDQRPDDLEEEVQRAIRRHPSRRLVHVVSDRGVVQEPETATPDSMDVDCLGEVRLGRRLPAGTGSGQRPGSGTGHRIPVVVRDEGVLAPTSVGGAGTGRAKKGGRRMVERVLALVRGGDTVEAAEKQGGPPQAPPAVEPDRLCANCVHGYLGAHGVYCVQYSEFIWDERQAASECEEFEP